MLNSLTQSIETPATSITPFQPQTEREEVAGTVIRMMLKFEILRVQLEQRLLDLNETERATMRQEATKLRVDGFRLQREAALAGNRFAYDDELLRREGTRIAYLLARNANDQAQLIEEEVVTISVNKALYQIDEEQIYIAA